MWEYRRTLSGATEQGKPQQATVHKCSDPSGDIQSKMATLRQKGCQFSPLMRSGDRYRSTWVCPSSTGAVTVRDVVTVTSATSYEDENETRQGQRVTHVKIVATRSGDCQSSSQGTIQSPSATTRAPAGSANRTR